MKKLLRKITAVLVAAGMMLPTAADLPGINLGMTVVASAAGTSGTCGTSLNWTLDESGTLSIKGSGKMQDFGYAASPWYEYRNSVNAIQIESGVTHIGKYAFFGCSKVSAITIPYTVTSIGNDAFRDCSGITGFDIPDSVISIGGYAFWGCSGITSITIPDSVTSIGSSPFNYCSNLQSITVEDSNTAYCSVDGVLFDKAKTVLINYPGKNSNVNYVIPNTVTKINEGAFSGSNIKSVTISNSVSEMQNNVFYDCASLESVVFEESSQRYFIPDSAFRGCTSLKNISIPGNVSSILAYAFEDCSGLESVTISEGVRYISEGAFSGCSSLKTVSIPKTVNSISERYVFSGCTSLESINVAEGNTRYSSIDGVLFNGGKTELILYPAQKSGTTYTVPNTVIKIADGAFDGDNLTSITIPSSVTIIGDWAFSSCESLTEILVDANNSIYSSENGVLFDKNKTELILYPTQKSGTTYTFPNTVTKIADIAFCGNKYLTSITIPSSVETIGGSAFSLCENLTEISVDTDNSAYSSENGVLFDKDKTTLVAYPIGKSDTSYSIPSGVTTIYDSAFEGSLYLKSVDIPNSVTYIDNYAFYKCPNLESIAFPPSVTLGWQVLQDCLKLESAFVPEDVNFDYQIDPDTMPTTTVRYTVSDEKANITKIELGTGQTTVDIPETICGYTVAGVAEALHSKVGKHTHKWDSDNVCALCGKNQAAIKTLKSSDFTFTPPSDLVYDGSAKEAEVTTTVSGAGDITVKYYHESGDMLSSAPVNVGTYTVKIDVSEGTDYAAATNLTDAAWTFTITKASPTTPTYPTYPTYPTTPTTPTTPAPTKEPEIKGENGKSGWDSIEEELKDIEEGDKAVIDMNGATMLPKNILEAIEGKDIDIVLEMGNGITWTINGQDIENPEAIDLNVSNISKIPAKVINKVTGEKSYVTLSIRHDGDFGFTATLTIDLGKKNKNLYANLYYYNTKTKKTEFVGSCKIDKNGDADFLFTHASDYIIIIDKANHAKPQPKATSTKDSITLRWKAVPGAEKYAVYKYVNGKAVKVKETKKLGFKFTKLKPGKKYSYIVRAYVDGKWTTMKKSDIVTVTTKKK